VFRFFSDLHCLAFAQQVPLLPLAYRAQGSISCRARGPLSRRCRTAKYTRPWNSSHSLSAKTTSPRVCGLDKPPITALASSAIPACDWLPVVGHGPWQYVVLAMKPACQSNSDARLPVESKNSSMEYHWPKYGRLRQSLADACGCCICMGNDAVMT
jgi:hypothetical protein